MITAAILFELAWKSFAVAAAVLGLLRLSRRRSAAERSWIAHCGLVALVLLAPAVLLAPTWNPLPLAPSEPEPVAALPSALPELAHATSPPATASEPAAEAIVQLALPEVGELAVYLYLVPLALLLGAMIVAVARLFAMHRRSAVMVEARWLAALAQAQRRMGFKHGTALLVSEELRSPVSWGMMRPIILLNPGAVSAVHEAEAIIAHELAHVARLDWAKLLISRVACALFWFNPLVWRLAREAHQLREEAADDAVLLNEVDFTDYAALLVNAARHDNKALLLAAHGVAPGKDSLKRRITRVLDVNLARRPANAAWIALCLVALFGVAGPLAALDPTARPDAVAAEMTFADVASMPGGSAVEQAIAATVPEVIASAVPAAVQRAVGAAPAALNGEHPHDEDRRAAREDKRAAREDARAAREDERAGNMDAHRLVAARAVGLSADYIQAMRQIGFADDDLDDLTGARAVGVTPEFAREMRRYSPDVDLDTVIAAKAVGMSPAYLADIRRMFPSVSFDDAVGMRAVGVTTAYASEMRALFPGASADQVQEMRAVGVTGEFVRAMRREGIATRTPDQAVEGRLFSGRARSSRAPLPPAPPPANVWIGPRRLNISGPGLAIAIDAGPDHDAHSGDETNH